MGRILALSSQVTRGHVGLSAIVPVLHALGHQVTALPTVLLSNHLGYPVAAGRAIEPQHLDEIVEALETNGWLGEIDAIMIGYLPSVAHVTFAEGLLMRLDMAGAKAPIVIDPVMGDDPEGLYIEADVAQAIRSRLLVYADVITPNCFELGWLTNIAVTDCDTAKSAAQTLATDGMAVVATSLPCTPREDALATLVLSSGRARVARQRKLQDVPHGTGDVLSAIVAGALASGSSLEYAVAQGLGFLAALIEQSAGKDELLLVPTQTWTGASPLALRDL